VFTEAKFNGYELSLEYYSYKDEITSTCGAPLTTSGIIGTLELRDGDFVFVPGMDDKYVRSMSFKVEKEFFYWLKQCSEKGIFVCSICNGAFALATQVY
jgi:transcriptional regulator GlxA family with amidase domain